MIPIIIQIYRMLFSDYPHYKNFCLSNEVEIICVMPHSKTNEVILLAVKFQNSHVVLPNVNQTKIHPVPYAPVPTAKSEFDVTSDLLHPP